MHDPRASLIKELTNDFDESMFVALDSTAVGLTTLHAVRPGAEAIVRDALVRLHRHQPTRHTTGLHTLHCGLLDHDTQLLFSAMLDPPGRDHIAEALVGYQDVLDPLWHQCVGYPAGGIEDPGNVVRFLSAARQPFQLICSGYPGASAKEVCRALDWMRKTMRFQIELAKSPKDKR